jgi:hypothetical protein
MLEIVVKKWRALKRELLLEKDNKKINELLVNGNKITTDKSVSETTSKIVLLP